LENPLDTQHTSLSGVEENTNESCQFNSNHEIGSGFDSSIELSRGSKSCEKILAGEKEDEMEEEEEDVNTTKM
jgi:hypothetical protein